MDLYPILTETTQVKKGKITTGGFKDKQRIKLNKENWQKMRHLWEQFANRYMLEFDRVNDDALQLLIDEMIRNKDNFTFQYPEFTRNELYYHDENGEMRIREQTANYDSRKPMTV